MKGRLRKVLDDLKVYTFGMLMPDRKLSSQSEYRYGFNGQESSGEVSANTTTALYWEYDGRIGRRWNLDPKPNAYLSDYSCFGNNPIFYIDRLGDTLHDNTSGFIDEYKTQAQNHLVNLSNFESNILKTPQNERSEYQNNALQEISNAKNELITSLKEIAEMEASTVHFFAHNTLDEKLAYAGEGATRTRGNFEKGRVEVDMYFNTIGSERGVVGHELKHAYQMYTGRANYGSLYDMNDEVEAYTVQSAFELSNDSKSILLLTTGIFSQNESSIRKKGESMANKAYATLQTISERETRGILMTLILENKRLGSNCARGNECLIGEFYIRKTIFGTADSFDDFKDSF